MRFVNYAWLISKIDILLFGRFGRPSKWHICDILKMAYSKKFTFLKKFEGGVDAEQWL